jgi:hypothetical protein
MHNIDNSIDKIKMINNENFSFIVVFMDDKMISNISFFFFLISIYNFEIYNFEKIIL